MGRSNDNWPTAPEGCEGIVLFGHNRSIEGHLLCKAERLLQVAGRVVEVQTNSIQSAFQAN